MNVSEFSRIFLSFELLCSIFVLWGSYLLFASIPLQTEKDSIPGKVELELTHLFLK